MKSAIAKVKSFHDLFRFSSYSLDNVNDKSSLDFLSHSLLRLSTKLEHESIRRQKEGDPSLYRAHLMIEELGELIGALARKNEIDLADALADLIYVVIGTAITYDIPLNEVFNEVHRSNMTKTRSSSDDRMRSKEGNYRPPNIKKAIEHGRRNNVSVS